MLRAAKEQARKRDTRDKIELGGLVVKAGLRLQPRALILGILLDGKRRLAGNAVERSRLLQLGAEGFAEHEAHTGSGAAGHDDAGAGSAGPSD